MKKLFILFYSCISLFSQAQKTYNPSVQYANNDWKIIEVDIQSDKTIIKIQSRTNSFKTTSIASTTVAIDCSDENSGYKILSLDNNLLDSPYKWKGKKDEKFIFTLVFPKFAPGFERINLIELIPPSKQEEGMWGFEWRGITINNPPLPAKVETTNNTYSNGTINMIQSEDGIYEIPVTINGVLKINFIFDSGASDVSIAPDVASVLIKTGTVTESDFIGSQTYTFADGSKATSKVFIIKSLKIGSHIVKDVRASISRNLNAPMLLGQSVQQKFGKIIIDNTNHTLKFED